MYFGVLGIVVTTSGECKKPKVRDPTCVYVILTSKYIGHFINYFDVV